MDEPKRRKIVVTGHDPWVRQHMRNKAGEPPREKEPRGDDERYNSARLRNVRRQSYVLSLIFLLLAVVIFFGVRIASPRIIVTLVGGSGIVTIDENIVVATGRLSPRLSVGDHTIRVELRDYLRESYLVAPDSMRVTLGYGLEPKVFEFALSPVLDEAKDADSTETGDGNEAE